MKRQNLIAVLRSEWHYANPKYILIGAISMLILGMLTGIFGGGQCRYNLLLLPGYAASATVFIILWSMFYLLIGGSIGFLIGMSGCLGAKCLHSCLFSFSLLILSNLMWYPLFFGIGAFFVAFLALVIHLMLTIFTVGKLYRVSLSVTWILCAYSCWLFYCLFLNFCIILLNS